MKVQREIQEAINTGEGVKTTDEAMQLLDKQDVTVQSLTNKDIRNLEKLKQSATDFSDLNDQKFDKVSQSAVMMSVREDDA